jgi:hypothetical protein
MHISRAWDAQDAPVRARSVDLDQTPRVPKNPTAGTGLGLRVSPENRAFGYRHAAGGN